MLAIEFVNGQYLTRDRRTCVDYNGSIYNKFKYCLNGMIIAVGNPAKEGV